MQVPGPFEYERATSVDHAVGLLDRLGEGARVVAGGHSLLPMMKLRIANPEYLVDINDLALELGYVITDPTLVRIGAMTRHREMLESETLATVCPIFRDAERVIADPVSAIAARWAARCARPTRPRTCRPCARRWTPCAWPVDRPGNAKYRSTISSSGRTKPR